MSQNKSLTVWIKIFKLENNNEKSFTINFLGYNNNEKKKTSNK